MKQLYTSWSQIRQYQTSLNSLSRCMIDDWMLCECHLDDFWSPIKDSLVTLIEHCPGNNYLQSGQGASVVYCLNLWFLCLWMSLYLFCNFWFCQINVDDALSSFLPLWTWNSSTNEEVKHCICHWRKWWQLFHLLCLVVMLCAWLFFILADLLHTGSLFSALPCGHAMCWNKMFLLI